MGSIRRLSVAAWLTLSLVCANACQSAAPTQPPTSDAALEPAYANEVLAYDDGQGETLCGDMRPDCDELGTCGPTELLGAPDDVPYALPAGGSVEISFSCNSLVERGGADSPELRLYGQFPEGTSAVVQVSRDGTEFDELEVADDEAMEFDLARLGWTDARFVRVVNQGPDPIEIDAFEALRNP